MTGQLPSVGLIVHYRLSQADADAIAFERTKRINGPRGNPAVAGDVYPAVVVRTFGDDVVNLQVKLDGPDIYWAPSRTFGPPDHDVHGRWFWPPRVIDVSSIGQRPGTEFVRGDPE